MSRFAFFVDTAFDSKEFYTSLVVEKALSLADLGHQMMILFPYGSMQAIEVNHRNLEIVQPFSSFGMRDLFKLFRLMHNFRPDWVHFFQPYSKLNPKLFSVYQMAGYFPDQKGQFSNVAISYWNTHDEILAAPKQQQLIHRANCISVYNQHQKNMISAITSKESLPIAFDVFNLPSFYQAKNIEKKKLSLLVPGSLSDQTSWENVLRLMTLGLPNDDSWELIFLEGYGSENAELRKKVKNRIIKMGLQSNIYLPETMSWPKRLAYLDHCDLLILSFLPYTSALVSLYSYWACQLGKTCLLTDIQLSGIQKEIRSNLNFFDSASGINQQKEVFLQWLESLPAFNPPRPEISNYFQSSRLYN